MLPVMSAFMDVVESEGMSVDTDQLADLQEALKHREQGESGTSSSRCPVPSSASTWRLARS
jgi:2-phospho-L-lactate guanylyltransferase (CobY/MobA/RfbA family)